MYTPLGAWPKGVGSNLTWFVAMIVHVYLHFFLGAHPGHFSMERANECGKELRGRGIEKEREKEGN